MNIACLVYVSVMCKCTLVLEGICEFFFFFSKIVVEFMTVGSSKLSVQLLLLSREKMRNRSGR